MDLAEEKTSNVPHTKVEIYLDEKKTSRGIGKKENILCAPFKFVSQNLTFYLMSVTFGILKQAIGYYL